ncbi:hypothetical protein [Marisediminicola antarctica]|uniref:hypothetical protein n=1 Tax=Marisediminicola antarctica TaxID=674079 RepID=UPI00192A60CD|nr:hypothetical protein [Marisediminicola antarctica]
MASEPIEDHLPHGDRFRARLILEGVDLARLGIPVLALCDVGRHIVVTVTSGTLLL